MNRALRAATMGALLLTPVALTACSAGQVNQTASQDRDKVGPQAELGDLELRQVVIVNPGEANEDDPTTNPPPNAPPTAYAADDPDARIYDESLFYAAGDNPELVVTIANTGDTADELIAIEAEGFDGVYTADPGAETEPTTPTTSAPTTSAPTPGDEEQPTPGDAPTTGAPTTGAAPTTAAAPSPVNSFSIDIPAGQNVTIGLRQYVQCPRPADEDDADLEDLCDAAEPETQTSGDAGDSDSEGSDHGESQEADTWFATVVDESKPRLFLAGLPAGLAPLTAGETVTITLVFRDAGEVTIDALVVGPGGADPRGPGFDFHHSEEGTQEDNEVAGGGNPQSNESQD